VKLSWLTTLLGVVLVGMLATGCGSSPGGIAIDDARVGQPTGPNAALYLTATSEGETDRLVAASTDVAAGVEIHQTTTEDGVMSMQRIDGLDLPAGESLVLEPGGLHLMLLDVVRLDVGAVIEVTLIWETAGEMTVEAEVVEPADTMSHDG
jgi:periplasmic copper chaperone A